MGVEGPERGDVTSCNHKDLQSSPDASAAECAARAAVSGDIDPDLARIIAAWPALSAETRERLGRLIDDAMSTYD